MDRNEAQYIKMTETPLPKLICSLAVPTIVSMMISAIYNTADTYFVSQLGTSASGAVGIVMSLMGLIQSSGFLIGMGAGSWISRLLGQKQDDEASEVAASGFYFALALGVLIAVFGTIFLNPLVMILGATETIRPYAMDYARYILLAAPFLIGSLTLNKLLCSEGKAKFAMVGITSGGILNMVLDPLFIFGLDMGIAGAAIATAVSQTFSFCVLLYMFVSGRTITKLSIRWLAKTPERYLAIAKNGLPSFFRQGMASVAGIALNIQAAEYGDSAVSAMAIVSKISFLVFSVVIGFGQGYQPVAGYNYGAKKYTRVKQAFMFMVRTATIFICVFSVIFFAAAPQLIRLFIDSDPAVIEIGTATLRFFCISMPFVPLSTCCNMTFQSIGKPGLATFLTCARQGYVYLPLIVLLPMVIGLTGVEAAQPLADIITFVICIPFVVKYFKELTQKQEQIDAGER